MSDVADEPGRVGVPEAEDMFLPISALQIHPDWQRRPVRGEHVQSLVQSFKEYGLGEYAPMTVVADGESVGYTIIDGQHRFLAIRQMHAEGMLPVDVRVRSVFIF